MRGSLMGSLFMGGVLLGSGVDAVGADLTYALVAHPSAVALQFDVDPGTSGLQFETIGLIDAAPHTVESALLANGKTRYVVYTVGGQAINPAGKILVSIQTTGPLGDGVISIENVVASDAVGTAVPADPNAIPIRRPDALDWQSALVGSQSALLSEAVDLDGQLASVTLLVDGLPVGTSSAAPFSVPFTPAAPGLSDLSVWVTDNRGATNLLHLGQFRAYSLAEVQGFPSFINVHFGPGAAPDFAGDPLGIGLRNGVAYLLGINPHQLEPTDLPSLAMEGGMIVFKFRRLSNAPDATWDVVETTDLFEEWKVLLHGAIHETDTGSGYHQVEVRIPAHLLAANQQFLTLQANHQGD